MADVMYAVRPGPNEELRYSLRALHANLPHDRVFIVGHGPDWLTDVTRIDRTEFSNKYILLNECVRRVCETDISDMFYKFDDDMFVMEPMEKIPPLHIGSLVQHMNRRGGKNDRGYGGVLYSTLQACEYMGVDNPWSFESHTPMLFDKMYVSAILEMVWNKFPTMGLQSVYGNVFYPDAAAYPDVKIRFADRHLPPGSLWSTEDYTFEHGSVGREIRKRFPNPSPYELT